MVLNPSDVPVLILAGGLGTRLKEHTEFKPKPMVEIGSRPILWHIMRRYGGFGFKRFVVCAGFKSEIIKSYFLSYDAMNSDFTVSLRSHQVRYHGLHHDEDWEVTVADTGNLTMTGARIAKAAARYLGNAEHFAVTYGDGLCNVDLGAQFDFHVQHGKIGTVLAVRPLSRFGELKVRDDRVVEFSEKPELKQSWINGGFFFFRRGFTKYLSDDEGCVLEREPLVELARDGQLVSYPHAGFWACLDTQRDKDYLEDLWRSGKAPWEGPAAPPIGTEQS